MGLHWLFGTSPPQSYGRYKTTKKPHWGTQGFPGTSYYGTLTFSKCSFFWRMGKAQTFTGLEKYGWVQSQMGTSPGGEVHSQPAAMASASWCIFGSRSETFHWNKDNPDGSLPHPWDVLVEAVTMAALGEPARCRLGQARGFLSSAYATLTQNNSYSAQHRG